MIASAAGQQGRSVGRGLVVLHLETSTFHFYRSCSLFLEPEACMVQNVLKKHADLTI